MLYSGKSVTSKIYSLYDSEWKRWKVDMTLTEERLNKNGTWDSATTSCSAFDEDYAKAITKCDITIRLQLEQNGGTLFPQLEVGKDTDAQTDSNTNT
jgi:hypothetical protein